MKPRAFWIVLVALVCCPLFGAACLWLCQTYFAAVGAAALVVVAGVLGASVAATIFTGGKDVR